ncbi:MAG: type II toxin-antitoxin system Phd/YefM family antitoxin [Terracidiphilus sp.]
MEKTVSAADANRKFSEILHGVRRGGTYVVTSHGKPIAKLSPYEEASEAAAGAHAHLLDRLRRQAATKIGRWTRDELYEDAR